MKLEVLDNVGNLKVPLSLLYIFLKEFRGRLEGPYIDVHIENFEAVYPTIHSILSSTKPIPEVEFCPAGEPQPLDIDDELSKACTDVYRYFPGDETSRCAACAVKVYSSLGQIWLVSEEQLIQLLELAREYNTPIEWSRGNIVYTTCPPDYRFAQELPPGSYVKGLEILRALAKKILEVVGYAEPS